MTSPRDLLTEWEAAKATANWALINEAGDNLASSLSAFLELEQAAHIARNALAALESFEGIRRPIEATQVEGIRSSALSILDSALSRLACLREEGTA